eukprot:768522-Hanusia_phi.AAC.9
MIRNDRGFAVKACFESKENVCICFNWHILLMFEASVRDQQQTEDRFRTPRINVWASLVLFYPNPVCFLLRDGYLKLQSAHVGRGQTWRSTCNGSTGSPRALAIGYTLCDSRRHRGEVCPAGIDMTLESHS